MRRWAIAFTAALALVSIQPVLAATFRQGVVQNFADLATASCHNPEGITADAGGTLYAAGLSGNICVVNGSGQITRVIPVAAGDALLGELFVGGQIYVADNNGDFSGGRVDRVNVATGAVTVIASGFANTNAFERDGNGTLYVSDSFRGAVYTVNPTTRVNGVTYIAVTGSDFKLANGTSGEIVWRNDIPRKWDQKDYLYPIPEGDLLTNPALKQNPGW